MSGPTPLWYTTRSAGMVVMILLTASVVLGVMTNGRWSTPGLPRFVTNSLHRNLSLLALVFLILHILTAILDSFAHLGLKDALIPFASDYRRLWMGVGVLGAELFVALIITSLVRGLLGYGAWRAIHLLAYVSWPLALLHGVGTGSDTKAWWALVINLGCLTAVPVALGWRIRVATSGRSGWRTVLALGSAAGTLALLAFMVNGPLKPGWALAAGTPASLLTRGQAGGPAPAPYALPAGLSDSLRGTIQQASDGSARIILTDARDPTLQLVITISDPQATSVTVAITHDSTSICSMPAQVGGAVTATCGRTALAVQGLLQSADGTIQGTLVTSSA